MCNLFYQSKGVPEKKKIIKNMWNELSEENKNLFRDHLEFRDEKKYINLSFFESPSLEKIWDDFRLSTDFTSDFKVILDNEEYVVTKQIAAHHVVPKHLLFIENEGTRNCIYDDNEEWEENFLGINNTLIISSGFNSLLNDSSVDNLFTQKIKYDWIPERMIKSIRNNICCINSSPEFKKKLKQYEENLEDITTDNKYLKLYLISLYSHGSIFEPVEYWYRINEGKEKKIKTEKGFSIKKYIGQEITIELSFCGKKWLKPQKIKCENIERLYVLKQNKMKYYGFEETLCIFNNKKNYSEYIRDLKKNDHIYNKIFD